MDRNVLESRLAELRTEYSSGKQLLAERETQAAAIREQLLRIGGAIRVLSELLAEPAAELPNRSQEEAHGAHSTLEQ